MKILMAVLATLGALLAAPAVASADDACQTYTTTVTGRPDSGVAGTWAHDTFTRTSEVCEDTEGSYTLTLTDTGTFTTVAGAQSPSGGADLPDTAITGTFTGGATLTVTSATAPHTPGPDSNGDTSSSDWPGLMFDEGYVAVMGAWSWTYATDCEEWTNASTGNSGDIVGEVCETETTTTSPPPSSTSSSTGTDTSTPGSSSASGTGDSSATTTTTTDVFYADCDAVRAADADPIRYGDAGYRQEFDSDGDGAGCETNDVGSLGRTGSAALGEDLAYTGTPGALVLVVILGGLLLAGGGAAVVLARRRRAGR